jgi:hypothetical protein
MKHVLLLHGNAQPQCLCDLKTPEVFPVKQAVYSHDLAPNDYQLFPALIDHLGSHQFQVIMI